ncbi:sensor histidine kinase [Kitasatospora sp. NPDC051853]|uniref:sensor histidine kinase n=1 Tax=Kitasatospora sp. NPDC051853 TaxID=3364058 RepID=UPI003791002D
MEGASRVVGARAGGFVFAVLGLPVALLGGVYALAVLYAGTLLSLTVLGLPLVAAGLYGARALGGPQRWLVARLLGEVVEPPAPLPGGGGVLARVRTGLTDPVGWRGLLHLGLRLPVGVLTFAVAVPLPLGGAWLVAFPLVALALPAGERPQWWLTGAGLLLGLGVLAVLPAAFRVTLRLNRYLARQLLGPAGTQHRVRQLERARSALLAGAADDLRRLERDLHDGTQAELVAIAITLSLAEDALGSGAGAGRDGVDPERLRALLGRARRQTDSAVTGLRRLTRGIHPVALDQGLAAALPALTAAAPVPVTTTVELPERPDPAVERAVYFCAAELLTNLAKHSGADRAEVLLRSRAGKVRLSVRDNGRGGAQALAGGGLAGLGERLAAVDGTLRVDSPRGGPTTVTAELPATL